VRSDFVEECRREWRRLRVPAVSAEEMADDLTADLREAEADGAFPEEVLGDGAADPRAFAAAWATERGLVRPPRFAGLRSRGAVIALVVVVSLAAALAVVLLSRGRGTTSAPPVASQSKLVLPYRQQIVGTEVYSAVVMPEHVRLTLGQPPVVLARRPTLLIATIKNSGTTTVRNVTLDVSVAGHSLTHTTGSLRKAATRNVTFALPAGLPSRFTLSVLTERVPGERNLSNNQAVWRIRVRR
jgi:hypothetical protein